MGSLDTNTGVKDQEYMFVEWSHGVNETTYDLKKMIDIIKQNPKENVRIADIGGGIGKVAKVLADALPYAHIDVIDNSELAQRDFFKHERTGLIFDNFLTMEVNEKYDYVIFRTVLHHFVAENESETLILQQTALNKTQEMLNDTGFVFVTENFYESVLTEDFTGRMIFELTVLKATEHLFRFMGANTAGEGVRFRSYKGWVNLFKKHNFTTHGELLRQEWVMPTWQKIPLLCKERFQGLLTLEKIHA